MKKWPLRIINYLTGFLVLSSIHCTIVALVNGGDSKTFLYSMAYLPAIILLSESQKQVKYFWQYAVCAVAALVFVRYTYGGIYGVAFEKTLGTVLIVIAISIYFYARAKNAECPLEAPEYYFLILYLIMWFLERQYPSAMLETYAVYGAGFYYLLCMYKTNIDEILQFIDLNEKLERFPEKRLLKNNLLMMFFQTVIVGTGMGIILSTGADGLLNKIVDAVRKVFAWLLGFLESDEQHAGSEVSGGTTIMPPVEAEETSAFMEMLLKILNYLSWVLVIALTLYALYRILKKIYQLYLEFDMNAAENGDEIEKIYTVQTKEEKRRLKKQKSESLRWDRSPNAKIRKYYKKRVLRDVKEIPGKSMTPEEIETNVIMGEMEKDIFHSYYEKARYGNESCTKEEMETYLKI